MTSDRLDQISRIYHEALSRSEDERRAFLIEACGGDQLLRQEIESLLKHDQEAGGFIETSALAVVAEQLDQLNPGSTIGTYSILSRAGSGGMGDVYHARDLRLGREVAIKCLPPSFATDPARRARFEREARLLATLNHPNIAQIHGLEDAAAVPAIVMEWVPGKTLSDLVSDGALPVKRALAIASQIADAIDAAHENGILHRDLKPANIRLRPDGVVKVLDFGLAKAFAADPMTAASTVAGADTVEGTVLGTPGYMSPEQARGQPVDKRTDIWAFGCVMYEMLAGRAPFTGPTFLDTLTAVIDREPAWSALPSSTPPRLRELLQRCLSKNPASRLRDIGDARLELAAIAAGNAWVDPPTPRTRWPRAIAGLMALAAVSVAVVIATRYFSGTPAPAPRIEFPMAAPPGTSFGDLAAGLAVSPDGRSIVMTAQAPGTGAASLWLRTLDSATPRLLTDTQGATFPAWSPDGRSIAFFAGGQLKRLDLAGGAPLFLCAAETLAALPSGASENRDGVILISGASGLRRVSSGGGAPVPVTVADTSRRELAHGYPQFLPDGDRFLYFIWSDDSNVQGVYAGALSAPGRRTLLVRTPSKAVFVPEHDGHPAYLLWMQVRTLLAQRIDTRSLRLAGDPSPIAQDVNVSFYNARPMFSVSDTGTLAYVAGPAPTKRSMVWMRRGDPAPVPAAPDAMYLNLALAPDGERIALGRFGDAAGGDAANLDVWIRDVARAREERITLSPARDAAPIWSPDGREIVHASTREHGRSQLYRRPASGDEAAMERLTDGPQYKLPSDWSRDGRYILYTQLGDVMALRLDGDRTPIPVAQTPFTETTPAFSPDGRWVSFAANYTGRFEIYVQPFPGEIDLSPQRSSISSEGGWGGKWSADGGEFFFAGLNGRLMATTVHVGPRGVRSEKPREVFGPDVRIRPDTFTRQFDVTPDGQRFLMILRSPDDDAPNEVTVVSNWRR
jgi:Tol biopolymer transport system component